MIFHKFHAKPQRVDGLHFASKKEAEFYKELCLRRSEGGDVLFFLRQVPFHLPEGEKYLCDFQVFFRDGTVQFTDIKGFRTRDYVRKKRLVETYYPITIEER